MFEMAQRIVPKVRFAQQSATHKITHRNKTVSPKIKSIQSKQRKRKRKRIAFSHIVKYVNHNHFRSSEKYYKFSFASTLRSIVFISSSLLPSIVCVQVWHRVHVSMSLLPMSHRIKLYFFFVFWLIFFFSLFLFAWLLLLLSNSCWKWSFVSVHGRHHCSFIIG